MDLVASTVLVYSQARRRVTNSGKRRIVRATVNRHAVPEHRKQQEKLELQNIEFSIYSLVDR